MTANRRTSDRFTLNIQTRVTASSATGETPRLEYMTGNISSGGAFLETNRPLPIASRVDLEFFLSLEELRRLRFILSLESLRSWQGLRAWVKASGVVIRIEEKGMGVIFDENYRITPMDILLPTS